MYYQLKHHNTSHLEWLGQARDPVLKPHSQFMPKIQVGHGDKSWSNLGRLRIDQDFTRRLTFDQHFTIADLDLD